MSPPKPQPLPPILVLRRNARETLHVRTQYQLLRRIGAGGMAVVHLAAIEREDGFTRQVAVKLIRDDFAEFPEFAKMFAEEAALAAKLTHPNIVGVFDYCRDERGRPFLVMELVNGISLRHLITQRPPMPVPVAAFILAEVLRGLGYAHQLPRKTGIRGLLHRDISPHNILLSWEGAVKLSDFGIAKALMTTSGVISSSGVDNGKPAYMSPEQVRNHSIDRRSDLFSLGTVFWEMLTGRKLFSSPHPSEVFKQIATGPIPPPSRDRPIGQDLEQVAMKLLEQDREQRYACAEDALADLLRCSDVTANGVGELVAWLADRCPPAMRGAADDSPDAQTASDTPASGAAEPPIDNAVPVETGTPGYEAQRVTEVELNPLPKPSRSPWLWWVAMGVVMGTAAAFALASLGSSRERLEKPSASHPVYRNKMHQEPTVGLTEAPPTVPGEASSPPAVESASGAILPASSRSSSAELKPRKGAREASKQPAAAPARPQAKPGGIVDLRFDERSAAP